MAIPEAVPATLAGLHDVLSSLGRVPSVDPTITAEPFAVVVVGERRRRVRLASGLPFEASRALDEVETTDIVLVPSLLVPGGDWGAARHPELVDWLGAMHERGALLCSACSGLFPIAETGLLEGRETTIHRDYARGFRRRFPAVA